MTSSSSGPCPCGNSKSYQECCALLHRGSQKAATAVLLMRSRYAAFHKGEIDYLVETLHPSKRNGQDRNSLQRAATSCQWLKLDVLEVSGGKETDDVGYVDFAAFFQGKQVGVLREKSRFVKEGDTWFYIDGEVKKQDLPGRNDPCWCGS
jgi:SEC-C motif domain protein